MQENEPLEKPREDDKIAIPIETVKLMKLPETSEYERAFSLLPILDLLGEHRFDRIDIMKAQE